MTIEDEKNKCLYDLLKYKLLKRLEDEAEKTVRYIEFCELTAYDEEACFQNIDRAILRYYALSRRIENLKIQTGAAE